MTNKKRAPEIGRSPRATIKKDTLILHTRRHLVKFDLERMGEILGDIFGGLALAAMLFAIPVITLLLTGGF